MTTTSTLLFRWLAAAIALALALTLAGPVGQALADADEAATDLSSPALRTPFQVVEDRDVDDRLPQPEDRYALAGGCYTIEIPGAGYVTRDRDEPRLTTDATRAEPFHFQATRLGEYLIVTNEGPDTSVEGAWWDDRGFLSADRLLPEVSPAALGLDFGIPWLGRGLLPAAPLPTAPTTDEVAIVERPSELGDWEIAAAGDDPDARVPGTEYDAESAHPGRADVPGAERRPEQHPGQGPDRGTGEEPAWQSYVVRLPATGEVLTVDDGELRLAGDGAEPAAVAFHLVTDAGQGPGPDDCARWPEIETNTSGKPEPASADPADEVEGFFEAHVHGMAYEFLGGEVRCGQPWHPYGVEYALGDCYEDGNAYNGVLEVGLAGRGPEEPVADYDPVGWPTFDYWPAHDTLSHEQYYWRWLERAYHSGVRLTTNLLVDNVALCEVFPVKRNSCNEMDGVRLQAERVFELQDYIDAQAGGPGEGWYRVVTSPAQAREAINAGRMAVVLGIEISELFDCREILDVPQCTEEQIDERLDEVFDMGVRQMQLINKFDNALSGVTGDGGETGLVVNTGNRWATGHWWDMQTCPEDGHDGHGHDDHGHGHDDHGHDHPDGDEHDRRQLNVADDTPAGDHEEIDVLAGIILDRFADTDGYVAPVYPEGPHCNTRGLSELGRYVLRGMIERGMIFDPDHMSALGQRQALDLIQWELIPAEQEAAAAEGRQPIQPAVLSSHSWANDYVYQRIYQLDGLVAPRTAAADGFVDRWAQHRDWAERWAPDGYRFGMGFGADTNGLGAQPGPRTDPAVGVDYETGWQAPIGGVTIGQQTSGVRTYDITDDGVAHYGLFADWFRELVLAADEHAADRGGGTAIIDDMLQGAETYLRVWERAVYSGNHCVADQSTLQREDIHALLGANLEGFLTAVGQPVSREDGAYIYCVDDGLGGLDLVEVTFDADGRAAELRPGEPTGELESRLADLTG